MLELASGRSLGCASARALPRHPRPARTAFALASAFLLSGHAAWSGPSNAGPSGPSFVPGLYETQSRNSAFRAEDGESRQCIASADYAAFRRETMARYAAAPQFSAVCRLSDTRAIEDGFAFAMDCTGARAIIAFRFARNVVASTTRTRSLARPEYSSTIQTLSRRIGDCRAQPASGNAR